MTYTIMPMPFVEILKLKCLQTKYIYNLNDIGICESNFVICLREIFIFYPSMNIIYMACLENVLQSTFYLSSVSYKILLGRWIILMLEFRSFITSVFKPISEKTNNKSH